MSVGDGGVGGMTGPRVMLAGRAGMITGAGASDVSGRTTLHSFCRGTPE
jgi:hypothetical protein